MGVTAAIASWACWFYIGSGLESNAHGARVALLLLVIGAALGFKRLFTLLVPLVLTKIWPGLDL